MYSKYRNIDNRNRPFVGGHRVTHQASQSIQDMMETILIMIGLVLLSIVFLAVS